MLGLSSAMFRLNFAKLWQSAVKATFVSTLTELRKQGNMGNNFPEPMPVFRNQVFRKGRNIQESVKLYRNNVKRDCI